jgi:hypothetical protein
MADWRGVDPAPPSDTVGHGEGTTASQFISPRLCRGGSEAAPLNGELPWPLVRSIPRASRETRCVAGIREAPNKLQTNELTPRKRRTSASFSPLAPCRRATSTLACKSLTRRSRAVTIGACKAAGPAMDIRPILSLLRDSRTSQAAHFGRVSRLIQGGSVRSSAISSTTATQRSVAVSPHLPTEQSVGRRPQGDWRIA